MYDNKLQMYMQNLLQDPNIIVVNEELELQINLPEYRNFENEESRTESKVYKAGEKGTIIKTVTETERKNNTITKIQGKAVYDEYGIETQREVTGNRNQIQTKTTYKRLEGKPHIIQENNITTGQERYFDIRDSKRFEDLDIKSAKEVKKEEIKELTQLETKRFSPYQEGIKKILGMQITVEQPNDPSGGR